ncbi:MAG TPA: CehA/McbA family metallohydrolase, partial [Kofleriaceae bacterium]
KLDARIDAAPPSPNARWLAGDLHMHVAPPDPDDVTASIADITAAAKAAGMDFVVVTPHLWDDRWADDRDAWRTVWRRFARDARAVPSPTLIPGTEWTTRRGHFTVVGADLSALEGNDFLAAAHAAGAFISANHPFAVPTHIPSVRISDYNMSYRVWSDRAPGFTAIDGAEVWNVPLAFANLVSRPGGRTGEQRAWTELDRVAHEEHRPMTAVGGTDDHHGHAMATTYVLAEDASEANILAALHAGRTCIGGPEAGSFRAHGDSPESVQIGGSVKGQTITLAWDGTAELFVDDIDRGALDGGFVDHTGGQLHTYRIVKGRSRSGFIYANL